MVKRVVGPIREFFEKCSDSPLLTRCKICQKTTSRGSSDPSKMTVTNLKNYLAANHGDEYKKFKNLESSQSQKRLAKSELEGASKCKQTKLSFSGNEGMTWDQNDARALKCHKSVLMCLIWGMIPYNEVTNAGFMQLIIFVSICEFYCNFKH